MTIVEDTALEDTEDFTVNITSTDEFVTVGEDTTRVLIVDNGELKGIHKQLGLRLKMVLQVDTYVHYSCVPSLQMLYRLDWTSLCMR